VLWAEVVRQSSTPSGYAQRMLGGQQLRAGVMVPPSVVGYCIWTADGLSFCGAWVLNREYLGQFRCKWELSDGHSKF